MSDDMGITPTNHPAISVLWERSGPTVTMAFVVDPADSTGPATCRVYWGHSACDLPRGHDPDVELRTHRQHAPSLQEVTVRDARLFGEDLTPEERCARAEEWGE